jgi:hypothetical protein
MILVASLLGTYALDTAAAQDPVRVFTARLFDLAMEAPACGVFQFSSLAVYDRIDGEGMPERVFVVHPCVELPRSQYSAQAGDLQRFVLGERHHLRVATAGPTALGRLVSGEIDPGDQPIYEAVRVDLVVERERTPRTLGDMRLDDPAAFPVRFREAARAVAASVGEPAEYVAQLELDRATDELVFHLWHQDAFRPENKAMVGNPGGKCRDVRYDRRQKKVVRTLFWQ